MRQSPLHVRAAYRASGQSWLSISSASATELQTRNLFARGHWHEWDKQGVVSGVHHPVLELRNRGVPGRVDLSGGRVGILDNSHVARGRWGGCPTIVTTATGAGHVAFLTCLTEWLSTRWGSGEGEGRLAGVGSARVASQESEERELFKSTHGSPPSDKDALNVCIYLRSGGHHLSADLERPPNLHETSSWRTWEIFPEEANDVAFGEESQIGWFLCLFLRVVS